MKAIVSVTGPDNLVIKVGLRHLAALDEFETRATSHTPELVITDRKVVLKPIRLMSRLVDPNGLATAHVSIDSR